MSTAKDAFIASTAGAARLEEARVVRALFDGKHDELTCQELREHVKAGCEHCRQEAS